MWGGDRGTGGEREREREREREGKKERKREYPKQGLCCQHRAQWGLHPRSLRSWLEPKSRVDCSTDWVIQAPQPSQKSYWQSSPFNQWRKWRWEIISEMEPMYIGTQSLCSFDYVLVKMERKMCFPFDVHFIILPFMSDVPVCNVQIGQKDSSVITSSWNLCTVTKNIF